MLAGSATAVSRGYEPLGQLAERRPRVCFALTRQLADLAMHHSVGKVLWLLTPREGSCHDSAEFLPHQPLAKPATLHVAVAVAGI
jgi:hypothetical protein